MAKISDYHFRTCSETQEASAGRRLTALQTHTANLLASILFSHVECLRLKMSQDITPKLVTQARYAAEQRSTTRTATSQFDCCSFFCRRPSGVAECLESFRIGCRRWAAAIISRHAVLFGQNLMKVRTKLGN